MEQSNQVQSPDFNFYVLYGMLFVNKFIYGAVLFFIGAPFDVFPQMDILIYIIATLALLSAVGSFYVVPFFLKPHAEKIRSESLNITNPEELKTKVRPLYFTIFIFRLALIEAIAIFGLALAFLKTSGLIYIPFALVSTLVLAIQPPNIQKDVLKKVQGSAVPPVLS